MEPTPAEKLRAKSRKSLKRTVIILKWAILAIITSFALFMLTHALALAAPVAIAVSISLWWVDSDGKKAKEIERHATIIESVIDTPRYNRFWRLVVQTLPGDNSVESRFAEAIRPSIMRIRRFQEHQIKTDQENSVFLNRTIYRIVHGGSHGSAQFPNIETACGQKIYGDKPRTFDLDFVNRIYECAHNGSLSILVPDDAHNVLLRPADGDDASLLRPTAYILTHDEHQLVRPVE